MQTMIRQAIEVVWERRTRLESILQDWSSLGGGGGGWIAEALTSDEDAERDWGVETLGVRVGWSRCIAPGPFRCAPGCSTTRSASPQGASRGATHLVSLIPRGNRVGSTCGDWTSLVWAMIRQAIEVVWERRT